MDFSPLPAPMFPQLARRLSLLEPPPPQFPRAQIDNRENDTQSWLFDPQQSNAGHGWVERNGPPPVGSFLYNPTPQRNTPVPYWQLQPGAFFGGSDTDNNLAQPNRMNVGMGFDQIPAAAAQAIMKPSGPPQPQPDIWIRQSQPMQSDPIADLINSIRALR